MWMFYVVVLLMPVCFFGGPINEIFVFTDDMGRETMETTENIHEFYTDLTPYGKVLDNEYLIVLEVQACRDSCILLSEDHDLESENLYEICYGEIGRTITHRRRYPDGKIESIDFVKRDILNCDSFTTIWAVWNNISMNIGTGPVSLEYSLLTADITHPFEVRGVGIKTGVQIEGIWKFLITVNFTGHYCRAHNARSSASMMLLGTTTQPRKILCALECLHDHDCLGFNFKADEDLNCELVAGGQRLSMMGSSSWSFYAKCLQDRKHCMPCRLQ